MAREREISFFCDSSSSESESVLAAKAISGEPSSTERARVSLSLCSLDSQSKYTVFCVYTHKRRRISPKLTHWWTVEAFRSLADPVCASNLSGSNQLTVFPPLDDRYKHDNSNYIESRRKVWYFFFSCIPATRKSRVSLRYLSRAGSITSPPNTPLDAGNGIIGTGVVFSIREKLVVRSNATKFVKGSKKR